MSRWKIDRRDLAVAEVRAAARHGLADAAAFLLEESNRTIPIEEGTLARSGSTSVDDNALRAAFSWDTPYAVRQHEDMSLRHDHGRRAKWAEQALKEHGAKAYEHVADAIRKVTS